MVRAVMAWRRHGEAGAGVVDGRHADGVAAERCCAGGATAGRRDSRVRQPVEHSGVGSRGGAVGAARRHAADGAGGAVAAVLGRWGGRGGGEEAVGARGADGEGHRRRPGTGGAVGHDLARGGHVPGHAETGTTKFLLS